MRSILRALQGRRQGGLPTSTTTIAMSAAKPLLAAGPADVGGVYGGE